MEGKRIARRKKKNNDAVLIGHVSHSKYPPPSEIQICLLIVIPYNFTLFLSSSNFFFFLKTPSHNAQRLIPDFPSPTFTQPPSFSFPVSRVSFADTHVYKSSVKVFNVNPSLAISSTSIKNCSGISTRFPLTPLSHFLTSSTPPGKFSLTMCP